MKIRILYDNKPTHLEVPDEDCSVIIDADDEERLTSAEDKEIVTRRSMQVIMEERFNKPEYNNWHKFECLILQAFPGYFFIRVLRKSFFK